MKALLWQEMIDISILWAIKILKNIKKVTQMTKIFNKQWTNQIRLNNVKHQHNVSKMKTPIPIAILKRTVKTTIAQVKEMIPSKRHKFLSKTSITKITKTMKFQKLMTIFIKKYGEFTLMKPMTSFMCS